MYGQQMALIVDPAAPPAAPLPETPEEFAAWQRRLAAERRAAQAPAEGPRPLTHWRVPAGSTLDVSGGMSWFNACDGRNGGAGSLVRAWVNCAACLELPEDTGARLAAEYLAEDKALLRAGIEPRRLAAAQQGYYIPTCSREALAAVEGAQSAAQRAVRGGEE